MSVPEGSAFPYVSPGQLSTENAHRMRTRIYRHLDKKLDAALPSVSWDWRDWGPSEEELLGSGYNPENVREEIAGWRASRGLPPQQKAVPNLSNRNKKAIQRALRHSSFSARALAEIAGTETMSEILRDIRDYALEIGAQEINANGDRFYRLVDNKA